MYLSAVAHHTNETMKFLTVVSSIFVPLIFVAGIDGMNFPNMPEFLWHLIQAAREFAFSLCNSVGRELT